MILLKTRVNIIDNSGGRFGEVLNILCKSSKSSAVVGDVLVLTLKKITPNKKVEKGKIYKGIVVKLKKKIVRYGGIFIKFSDNGVILLNSKKAIIGTRVLSIVAQELKEIKCVKILSLAPSVF